jgi:hypothetical protein
MKKTLAILSLVLAALALSAGALADDGGDHGGKGKGKNDADHARLTYTVTTTDNGSCGQPWAADVVKRTFVVKKNANGTYTLTRYDRGQFTTTGGVSPGACDTDSRHGKTVRAGVKGKLVGYLRGTVSGGTFNPKATCTGTSCGFTDTFLSTFFGANATFSCFENSKDCKFNFEYTAARGQDLLFRHWQDKGKGAGTSLHEVFHGDIADA